MQKYNLFLVSSLLLFALVFSGLCVRYTISNHVGFAAAVLSLTGLQNATSSPQVNSTITASSSLIEALQQLQDQEQYLTNEVMDLRSQMESTRLKGIFTRILKRGDSGEDVKMLQTLLSNTSTSTTGFYGVLTEKAVKVFQMSIGLKGTGIFDAETQDALISSTQGQTSTDTTSTDFVPIDLSSVVDPQQSVQNLQDQISQLTSKISDNESVITDLQSRVAALESQVSDVQSNVTTLSSLPQSSAAPVVQPLAISNIQASGITRTSVTVTWTTNNPATSEVDYSQNSSMPVNQTLIAKSSTMDTSHSSVLPSLASGTTYYYHIISKDGSNTIANSSNLTFTTLH